MNHLLKNESETITSSESEETQKGPMSKSDFNKFFTGMGYLTSEYSLRIQVEYQIGRTSYYHDINNCNGLLDTEYHYDTSSSNGPIIDALFIPHESDNGYDEYIDICDESASASNALKNDNYTFTLKERNFFGLIDINYDDFEYTNYTGTPNGYISDHKNLKKRISSLKKWSMK